MGILYKSGRIRSYILIILFFVTLFISSPLKKKVVTVLYDNFYNLENDFYEATGLHVSYKSISPSIMSNLLIRDIQFYDEENKTVLAIEKAKVTYNLLSILKGNRSNLITSIVVDTIDADVDRIVELVSRFNTKSEGNSLKFSDILELIPSSIRFKNIVLHYDNSNYETELTVKNVTLSNNLNKQMFNLQIDTSAKVRLISLNKNVTCKMNVSGTVTPQLENSQLIFKISDVTDGQYFLNKLTLHLAYENKIVNVHTIQSVNPLSLAVDYYTATQDLNIQFRTEQLSPLSILSINSKQKELAKLKKISIDTDTIVKCNFADKQLNFITDTELYIPDELFPAGVTVNFSLFGNEKNCELSKFTVEGENLNASAKLELDYKLKQVSGFAELKNLILNNGKQISTELYFDPLETGFMAFSPQLFIGDNAFTALQFSFVPNPDSYDFNFEAYDYSHVEDAGAGLIQMDGSYLQKSKYIQTNIGLNTIYLDSIAGIISQLLNTEAGNKIDSYSSMLEPYALSGDLYVSTDLKSISYNIPYILIANTQKDDQFLMVAMNGSNQNVQINQLSLISGKYVLDASATIDSMPEDKSIFYTVDLNSASIPYHFSGSIMQNFITATGDYGASLEVTIDKNNGIDGYAFLENLPLSISNNSFIFSVDSQFHYDALNGPEVQLRRFEAEIADSTVSVTPKIVLTGNMTKYGAQFNSISYTDMYSTLEGTSDLMLNINEDTFDSVGIFLNLRNPVSEESISIDGSISNPEHLELSKDTLMKNIYVNLQTQLNSFGLNRFGFKRNDNNRISATLYTSGTFEHPYLSLNIDESSVLMASEYLKIKGSLFLEERDLSVNNFFIKYGNFNFNELNASANLDKMVLDANAEFILNEEDKGVVAPFTLTVSNSIIPEGKILPDSFTVNLETKEVSGTLLKKKFPLSVSAIYTDELFSIYSSENFGLEGSYSKSGILQVVLDNKDFLQAKLEGYVTPKEMALQLYDVSADLRKIYNYVKLDDIVQIDKGTFDASVLFTGTPYEPEFDGTGTVRNLELKIPFLSTQKLSTEKIDINFIHEEIEVEKFALTNKSGNILEAGATVFLNMWSFNRLESKLNTVKNNLFPVKLRLPIFVLTGDLLTDLDIYYENSILELNGKFFGENVLLDTKLSDFSSSGSSSEDDESDFDIKTDLNITLGTHSSVNLDPILRCVFVPNTSMTVVIDETEGLYTIGGKMDFRSGDLAYINRNFYIKSGSIKFNPGDISNPIITVNAETREKNDSGQLVKIILDVENQYLMDMNPRFSSTPSMSEYELQSLLGQLAVADSKNAANFLFAASDYAFQSTVVRTTENKLRDLFNFDIFSLRTNFLQNTFNRSVSKNVNEETLTLGNLLDNSTVYIGKYLGNSLYVDAMLHVTVENKDVNALDSAGSVIFQPEFGMEMESPFANIRVDMAPNINALLNNQFVPSASVTLSWKYTF